MQHIVTDKNRLEGVLAIYQSELVYYPTDKRGRISNGELLTMETAKRIFKTLNKDNSIEDSFYFEDLIPQSVIDFSKEEKYIVWHTPAQKRNLYFVDSLSIESAQYYLPDLIWKLQGDKLNIWAIKGKPTSKTNKLYIAPMLNINSQGDVCMGNIKFSTTKKNYEAIIQHVENGFFNSYFTHTNFNDLIKGNITEIYKSIVGQDFFNWYKILNQSNLTINDILI